MVVVLHKARELYIIKKTGTREVVGLFRVVVEAHGTTRQTFAKHVTACGLALGLRMTGTAAALIRHNLSRIYTSKCRYSHNLQSRENSIASSSKLQV
jgi:hypothetical protein